MHCISTFSKFFSQNPSGAATIPGATSQDKMACPCTNKKKQKEKK